LSDFTLSVIARVAFGDYVKNESDREIIKNAVMEFFNVAEKWTTHSSLTMPKELKDVYQPKLVKFSDFITDVIRHERQAISQGTKSNCLLSQFVSLKDDETNTYLGEREISPVLFDFFAGGVETTSMTLQYALYVIGTNPEIQEKLYEEVKNTTDDIDYTSIQKISYVEHVLKEVLRLWPAAPVNGRSTNDVTGAEINGYKIPARTNVMVNTWKIHKDPRFWKNPEKAIPERFEQKNHPCAWGPFGFGARSCVGQRISMLEAKIALIYLYRNYKINFIGDTDPGYEWGITMKPTRPVVVSIEKRI